MTGSAIRCLREPFETELLERANVTVSYDNRQALTKEELYGELCRTLDEEASVRVDVYRFTHRHRYEESYFFGDFDSELVRYALKAEEPSHVKLGACMRSGGAVWKSCGLWAASAVKI
ncbi:hypothetical protein LJK87_17725 [Paenibacillus sp. P25]|nr:hypothetical protein LJK87_17725 [Paenibacillus sp. P25]